MSQFKMQLNDGTDITILEESTSEHIKLTLDSEESIASVRERLSRENLVEFKIFNEREEMIGNYQNYILKDTTYNEDNGVYNVTFNIRPLSNAEVQLAMLQGNND